MKSGDDITVLLDRARLGDDEARQQVLPLAYARLRELAAGRMRRVRSEHTLQATALVHEAYIRVWGKDASFENRAHFYFVASRAMRDILVEHARKKDRPKHGGVAEKVSLDEATLAFDGPSEEIIALDEALKKLERQSQRQYDLVMLRFFGGLTSAEAAKAIGISERTAERDWRFARVYLHTLMTAAS